MDDNIQVIRKKLMTFYHEQLPAVERFRSDGILDTIDAEKSWPKVWEQVAALFGPMVMFVLGSPLAGKETQCEKISEAFGYQILVTRDLLRAQEGKGTTEVNQTIENYVEKGAVVPGKVVVEILVRAMKERGWEGGKYLIHGFPRSLEDWETWKRVLGRRVQVMRALQLNIDEAGLKRRLVDLDTLEVAKKNLDDYQRDTLLVAQELQIAGLLTDLDANEDQETVWSNVQRLFGPSIIFALGGPGSGRRTQCGRIAEAFGYQPLNAVEVLKEEAARPGSELGALIAARFKEGGLVPGEVTARLLQRVMEEKGWEGGKYVIDAFPRHLADMDSWNSFLSGKVLVKAALYFECSNEVQRDRLVERCPSTKDKYSLQRLKTLELDFTEVANRFERDGLLRRIDAEQNLEAVWSCVRETLHLEVDAHLTNTALIILKPHASNPETERFVKSFFASRHVAVVESRTVSSADAQQRGLFQRQHRHTLDYAAADPRTLPVGAQGKALFREAMGVVWDEVLAKGQVVSAQHALKVFGMTDVELDAAWRRSTEVTVGHSIFVARISSPSGGDSLFVVNGFALHWQNQFTKNGEQLRWFIVEFSPKQVTWKQFLDVLGNENPALAAEGSLRGQLYRHWQSLEMKEPPSIHNCIHGSRGPVEALHELMIWVSRNVEDHSLGRSLLVAGVDEVTIRAWTENALVNGWRRNRKDDEFCTIFEATEACDHGLFRAEALRYHRQSVSPSSFTSLSSWTMREPQEYRLPRQRKNSTIISRSPCPSAASPRTEKPEVLTILHFNDVYNVEPRKKEPVGGISRFVTRVAQLKAEALARGEPEAMCVFSGDAFNPSITSTVTKGVHMVPALNAVGIDVAVFGNHDFDFGVDELVKMSSDTNFPWLLSNVKDKATGKPLGGGLVTMLMDWHGRKLGLMGLVEKEWLVTLHTLDQDDVDFEDFCSCGRRLARGLREEGAELILALTHMRAPNDELLANEVEEIDIIFGGHDHHYEVKPVGPYGTYVLNSGTDFRDLTVLRLKFNAAVGADGRRFEVLETRHEEITSAIDADPAMEALVKDCIERVGGAMDEVLGETAVQLDITFASIRTKETNIGNFVTDVIRDGLKADIALLNSGSLRTDAMLDAGPFRMRDLCGLMPMLDELCLLELTGDQVLAVLQNGVSQYPRLEGRFLQVSGISFAFDAALPPGERVVKSSVLVNEQPLAADASYRVCTVNYLRSGKDGFDVLKLAPCLADGEQAGILPTMVREHFVSLASLNGYGEAGSYRTLRAGKVLDSGALTKVGDGPSPMQHFAIRPKVEGRIRCLNPVAS
eukprot:TRINITY_DN24012_c0_g1_i1.p1 TRINITY_DN24012_c0_g1~~TRINITY_DN24012_c0_g1_i1.p1  ORF type:complete len:1405 (-),score=295.46 TRINITY_DN24012_c0_g1_i1:80-4009(-)